MGKILYTVAKDPSGNLINAKTAEKGIQFSCPVCDKEMLLRKSGNTTKNSKRPHFAHKTLTPNCTPETALHFLFKNKVLKFLEDKIEANQAVPFSWKCKYCPDSHSGNLIKKIKEVRLEYSLNECRPDIVLLDANKSVFAVIEVVVTHAPEKEVLTYCKKNNIVLIQINLTSDEDLNNFDKKFSNPDVVSICFNPKCTTCGHYLNKSTMMVIDGPCYKCGHTMKVAVKSEYYSTAGPDEFSPGEIETARSHGAIIQERYSKTRGERYLANVCKNCNSFAGDHYLYTDYAAPASYGTLPSIKLECGYHCPYCSEGDYEEKEEKYW